MRRKKFNFPLFIILWISHRVTNLTHAVYFWWTVASIILPVFLHIQIVQAFVCQLSSLYRIAPSSSPQLSSFMSLFNGSRLQTYCPVACPSLWTVWTKRTLWAPLWYRRIGLRIHFSGYRGRYTQTGRSMNQADHPRILLFEIGRIHRFVVYKASIHKYSQLGNSHHQSIAPLKVCYKFNIKKLKIVKWRFDQNGPTAFVELDLESEGQTFFCFFIFLHWTWLQPKPPSWRWIPHSSLFLYLKGFIHAFWTGFRFTLILLYDIHVCEHCLTDIVWLLLRTNFWHMMKCPH